jgi:hypothetical protein
MKIDKTCKCGKKYNELPKTAKEWKDEAGLIGWLFNCSCQSTLFIPSFTLKNLIRRAN